MVMVMRMAMAIGILHGHGPGGSGIVVIRYLAYYSPAKSTTGSPNTYVVGPWRVYKFIQSGTISF